MFSRSLAAVIVILSFSPAAMAQQSLTGVLRDGSGAVVPGGAIVVRQSARAFERLVESGRDGRFSIALGRRVLIVPHLLSFGGIEKGLLKRLEGLEYTITTQALIPDDRVVEWVLASAPMAGTKS